MSKRNTSLLVAFVWSAVIEPSVAAVLDPVAVAVAVAAPVLVMVLVVLVVMAVDDSAASDSSSVSSSTIIRPRLSNVTEDVPTMGGRSLLMVPFW